MANVSSAGATAATTLLHPPPGESQWGADRALTTNAFDAALGSELAKLAATLRGATGLGSSAATSAAGPETGGGQAQKASTAAVPRTLFGGASNREDASAVSEVNNSRSEMLHGLSLLRQELSAQSDPDVPAPRPKDSSASISEARQESIAAMVDAVLNRTGKDALPEPCTGTGSGSGREMGKKPTEREPREPSLAAPTPTPLLTRMQIDLQALAKRVDALEAQAAKQVSDPTAHIGSLKVPASADPLVKAEAVIAGGSIEGLEKSSPLLELATALASEVQTRRQEASDMGRRFQEIEQTLKSMMAQPKSEGKPLGTFDTKLGEDSELAASLKELSESISVERSSRRMQISELRSSLVEELSSRTQVLSESMTNKVQHQMDVLAEEIQSSLVNTLPPQMLALIASIGQAQGHDFMSNQLALPPFVEDAPPAGAGQPAYFDGAPNQDAGCGGWVGPDEGLADPYAGGGLPGHHTMQQNNITGHQYQSEFGGLVVNAQQYPQALQSHRSHGSSGEHDFAGEAELDPYQNSSPRAPGSGDLNHCSEGSLEGGGNIVDGCWVQPPEQLYDGQGMPLDWQLQQQQQQLDQHQQQQIQQIQFQPKPVLQTIYSDPPGNPFDGPIPAERGNEQLQNSVRQLIQKVENRVRLAPVTVMTTTKSHGPPPIVQVEGTGTPLRASSAIGTPLAPTRTSTSTVVAQPVYYRGVSTPLPQTTSSTGAQGVLTRQVPGSIVTGSPQGGSASISSAAPTPAQAQAQSSAAAATTTGATMVRMSSNYMAPPFTERGRHAECSSICRRCLDDLRKENASLRAPRAMSETGGPRECHNCHHTIESTAPSYTVFGGGGGSLYATPGHKTGTGVRTTLRSASVTQGMPCASPLQVYSVPGSASIRQSTK